MRAASGPRRARRLALLLFGALLLNAAGIADAAELRIDLAVADDGALLVTYTAPSGVESIPLVGGGPAVREVWSTRVRSLDDCASVDDQRIVLRADPACTAARFRVEPALMSRYAIYEAAYATTPGSILTYADYFGAALPGVDLLWRWHAPAGGHVLHQGRWQRGVAEEHADASAVSVALADRRSPEAASQLGLRQYVYLGGAEAKPIPGGVLLHDASLPAATLALVEGTVDYAMQRLGRAYGRLPLGPVGIVTSTAEMRGYRGDVTDGRMMALRFGIAPDTSPDAELRVRRFISHEVAHWWNQGVVSSDYERPWLHEGHADWVALLLLRESGRLDDAHATEMIEGALDRCVAARGDRPAASLPTGYGRGDDPYACGMSLMLLAQAEHRRRTGAEARPLDELATLHPRDRRLDVAALAAWADGADTGPMHALLLDPAVGFEPGLRPLLRELGLADAIAIEPGVALSPGIAQQLSSNLLQAAMGKDCEGRYGFYGDVSGFRLDTKMSCATLRLGQTVTTLDAVPLLTDPVVAWRAVTASCAASGTAVVGYTQGEASTVHCPNPFPKMPLERIARLRPEALARLGLAPP